ncbi:hypothetical protein AB1Y20_018905 [Prymnesium parvum]|uniref:Uncharacterized protein n=1 Tax=Prymnesium parvum TaxID=97485 RepID=A0AB34JTH5_PRYPA
MAELVALQRLLRLHRGETAAEQLAAASSVAQLVNASTCRATANAALLQLAHAASSSTAAIAPFVTCLSAVPLSHVLNPRLLVARAAAPLAHPDGLARAHALRALGYLSPLWAEQPDLLCCVSRSLGAEGEVEAAEAAAALHAAAEHSEAALRALTLAVCRLQPQPQLLSVASRRRGGLREARRLLELCVRELSEADAPARRRAALDAAAQLCTRHPELLAAFAEVIAGEVRAEPSTPAGGTRKRQQEGHLKTGDAGATRLDRAVSQRVGEVACILPPAHGELCAKYCASTFHSAATAAAHAWGCRSSEPSATTEGIPLELASTLDAAFEASDSLQNVLCVPRLARALRTWADGAGEQDVLET